MDSLELAGLVFGVAVLPTLGSSVAIPMAIALGMNPVTAVVIGVAGAVCKVPLAIWMAGGLRTAVARVPWLDRKLCLAEAMATARLPAGRHWGWPALTLCSAVPVPGMGIWTAAVAARLLGFPPLATGLALALGLMIAGTGLGVAAAVGIGALRSLLALIV